MSRGISTGASSPERNREGYIEKLFDIEKLKTENNNLFKIIERISPQKRFEDKGKTFLEVEKRQQERKLQTLATRVEQALWFSQRVRI